MIIEPEVQLKKITSDAQNFIIECARHCYDSYDKSTPESDLKLLKHILKVKHLSVFEHASASFLITNVSRAFTHQLVRHRHFSFSQQSFRYVKTTKKDFVFITNKKYDKQLLDIIEKHHEHCLEVYNSLLEKGMLAEDARDTLSGCTPTSIIITGNFRCWLEFLSKRLSKKAQKQIRYVSELILNKLNEEYPDIFNIQNIENLR